MTGTMISSISKVETTTRLACWSAMSPDGFMTTVLHPASKANGNKIGPRRIIELFMR